MRIKTIFLPILLGILCLAGARSSALSQDAETKREVPELDALHEVIYPLWHTAYPSKDYAALRGFVPQIRELAAKVNAAKLPGILREKQAKWAEGVAALKKNVEGFAASAEGKDDAALLKAAENLHTRFEYLYRVISPVLPEVDTFHQALYVVYHRHLPGKDFDKIREAAGELKAKAEAAQKASIPRWISVKADVYKQAADELAAAAGALVAAAGGKDDAALEKAVEFLHTKYQALQSLFD